FDVLNYLRFAFTGFSGTSKVFGPARCRVVSANRRTQTMVGQWVGCLWEARPFFVVISIKNIVFSSFCIASSAELFCLAEADFRCPIMGDGNFFRRIRTLRGFLTVRLLAL